MTPEQFLEFARPLPEPMFLVTSSGQILAANLSLTKILGLNRQIIQEKTLFEVFSDPADKIKQYLRACSSSREMVIGSLTLNNNGETYLYRCEGAVIRPWSPESPALILLRFKNRESASSRFTLLNKKIDELAKEIRQRQLAEEERAKLLVQEQKARAEAEKLNRLKDEFLSNVSHELRTPLNAILGWSQLLRTRETDEVTRNRALETIERNARSQAQLIDDLLDISRIITGKIRLNVQTIQLLSVIEAAIDTVRPAADAKSIRIQSVLDPAAGPVLGDHERLQQIVWNLLSNAIKFTPKHGRVQVYLQRINSHIEIVVTDTGQGISSEFLPYVFERFRQADISITRSFGGLGLGLAIVRQLVELHGGTVHAESPGPGQGATFTVKLPLMAVRATVIEPERVHPVVGGSVPFNCSSQLDQLKILIVDDDPDMRDLLIYTIEVCGAEVIAAASANEAILLLSESSPPFDILISDIGMPDQDGYALLRRVRRLEPQRGGKIPAIALTAYARTQDRTAALLAGFQSHIAKPVEPAELIAVIANLAGRIRDI
ncbi:PAS/PAC sensor hybrid histidine kinase [Stanieria cyanosphaera PCC 7437]|uniref:Circadian input-output histidine kinase CikA n=1 Tax=Stanieria cyanosphaera (strain ATCC 29371 / PCC 7437) TaxID=111780 RepID=K9XZ89_STAC7|nr:ATP-binding protein [Stanieria cyanosphaera]AFZ37354.1 PAS/PAC sensor hybrid histidine kinase [Stanieria cyanosphaera PCC 7437]